MGPRGVSAILRVVSAGLMEPQGSFRRSQWRLKGFKYRIEGPGAFQGVPEKFRVYLEVLGMFREMPRGFRGVPGRFQGVSGALRTIETLLKYP